MGSSTKKPRFTSPGVLLILAIAAGGGILLLDQFALVPSIARQKASALRDQALRAELAARTVLDWEQSGLIDCATSWAGSNELRRLLASPTDASFGAFASSTFGRARVTMAWLAGPDGKVLAKWHQREARAPDALPDLSSVAKETAASSGGLVCLSGGLAVMACQVVPPDPGAGGEPAGYIWLGRRLDAGAIERIGTALGGRAVFVASDTLPDGMAGGLSGSQALWSADDDNLAVAWSMTDITGSGIGYFRADVPVAHIRRQTAAARRATHIVLALSLGLCVLVVAGTHILVAAPVMRLLRRVQHLEEGDGKVEELTRDLHGEPRVLARRLESTFEKLASMSKTDQLTNLANRRHFEQVLNAFYYQARRYNRPLSMMMMDVDFFKAINDSGGHQAGDELLQRIAECIEKACRKADLPARLGGDEFAVLLPETDAHSAAAVAERVRNEISQQAIVVKGTEANVTVSIGLTDLNSGEIISPDTMMQLADRAMYTAKGKGRNRVFQAAALDGMPTGKAVENEHVSSLSKKIIGLDTQFKDMFVQGLEEIMEILAHRDPHMAAHARKVQYYAVQIATEMGLPDRVIKRLRIGAMLHDIGMLALPDSVLLCEDRLSEEQLQAMRRHPLLSVRIMEGMEFLEQEIPTVRYHHERFDGKGYPEGLAGAAIPLTARVLAVADAFDAMTSPRTFRAAKSISEALEELRQGSRTQFDPAVIESIVSVAGRMGQDLLNVPNVDRSAAGGAQDHDLPDAAEQSAPAEANA